MLIQVCLNETNSRVHIGKHLSDMFPIKYGFKQGNGLSPLLFSFALECAITSVQVYHEELKLSGKCSLFR
jgi:hypothetical protein